MINITYFSALFLIFLRVLTFFIALEVLFPNGFPNMAKIGLSMLIAYFVISGINYSSLNDTNTLLYFQKCCFEVITGLALGYLTNLAFICGRIAGQFIDTQMGFAMMSIYNPTLKTNTTVIENLLQFLGVIIFLLMDGHLILIKAIMDSFKVISIGSFSLGDGSAMYALNAFIQFFGIAIRIALPIILILIITDIVLGLISRTVPQLNVMILSLPVKVLLGLFVLTLSLPVIVDLMAHAFNMIPDMWKGFYKILPGIIIFAADDKTENATPKKKSDARKKGQVARSKDIPLAVTLLTSSIILVTLGDFLYNRLRTMMIVYFSDYVGKELTFYTVQHVFIYALYNIGIIFLCFAVPIMVAGIAANIMQTGFMFTGESLKPDFKKLNPISGFKKMFSVRTVVDLLKDVLVVLVVGIVGYQFIMSNFNNILAMNTLNFTAIPNVLKGLIVSIFLKISVIMAIIAATDYIYQRFMFNKELKMSKQEVKDEFKQDEGDPKVKSKRKQKMRELASRRMMSSVPDATVVITNPTHVAVALKYVEGDGNAPVLLAKGLDRVALKIKEVAKENEVPIIENKPLARLIYKEVEIEDEIPTEMYQAVAEILAIVFKMKKR
ncbi:MAG: fused FliR family export protein/FlhB family type III secretion system protein [Clostridium sp.]|nr:fused FliR family export protein/FlhB family type III secretion system protein [Clostridium sp.]